MIINMIMASIAAFMWAFVIYTIAIMYLEVKKRYFNKNEEK